MDMNGRNPNLIQNQRPNSPNNNSLNIPIYQNTSITNGRRRRNLIRTITNLFSTPSELVDSIIESSGEAAANTFMENFISFERMNSTRGLEVDREVELNEEELEVNHEVELNGGELEIVHEAGLSEGEIMMSVERLTHCKSCFMSQHEGEVCSICQGDYNHGEDVCKLHCNHIYHFDCINTWLMQKNLCPICKAPAMYV